MSFFGKSQTRKKTKRKTKATAKKITRMKTQTTATLSERPLICVSELRMEREDFVDVPEEALDSLPDEFRSRIKNVAILVEDFPPNQRPPKLGQRRQLLLGIFHGVPATKRSVFNLPAGPEHIVVYQKNIEAVCSNEAEVRHQIRQTLIHELGHYFGMTEEQLKDV
jgi:predicted Zn-dependent protease with MMP-like domain